MGFDRSAIEESGVDFREMPQKVALEKFDSWRKQGHLFRFMEDQRWLCLCCMCGCQWSRDEEGNRVADSCNPSPHVETTDLQICALCGGCVNVCSTDARGMGEQALSVDSDKCNGCSACKYACPEQAVSMIAR
jgi:ferredoxin